MVTSNNFMIEQGSECVCHGLIHSIMRHRPCLNLVHGLIFWVFLIYLFILQYVHFLQRKHSLGSFDLLGHTAPVQAASLLLTGPFVDYWLTEKKIYAYDYTVISMVRFLSELTRI